MDVNELWYKGSMTNGSKTLKEYAVQWNLMSMKLNSSCLKNKKLPEKLDIP